MADQKGKEFRKSDYGNLKKTYSIWLMMDPCEGNRNTVVKYRMTPTTVGNPEEVEDLDTMNIIFLNLGGEYGDEVPEELGFMTALFSSGLSEKHRRSILKDKYNTPADEYPKQELDSMGVFYEDTKSRFLREGRIEGKIEGKIESVISLMERDGFTFEHAVDTIADSSNRDAIIEGVKLKLSADSLN